MKSYTAADLERLARGQRVPGDVFRGLFADAGAVDELARLLQVRELLTPAEPDGRPPADPPEMNVTWEELARHGEGLPLEPTRQAAVEEFLGRHFPPPEGDTVMLPQAQDTQVDFREKA